MHIIIIGAGEVGRYLAQILIEERHDVCVIEQDEKLARQLDDTLDCQVVHGTGVSRAALIRADVGRCDLLIAATQVDEVNLVAAMTAERVNADCRTVARVRDTRYLYGTDAIQAKEYGVDLLIGPEEAVAEQVVELLQYVGPGQISPVADGRAAMLELPVMPHSALVYATLEELSAELPEQSHIVAVLGSEGMRIPDANERFVVGERIFVLCARDAVLDFLKLTVADSHKVERVLLIGGGNIGLHLAKQLQRLHFRLTILEKDPDRAEQIAVRLNKAVVIQGDGTEPSMLAEQMRDGHEAVVVLLDDDEKSILTAVVAKNFSAKKVIARVDKREYIPIAHKLGVDAVISPRRAVADAILRFVRRGHIASTTMLGDHQGELIDFEVGPTPKKQLTEQPMAELKLPAGCRIGLIVRGERLLIPRGGEERIQPNDHVYVVALRDSLVDLEQMFA